jgi:hypothetical protein
MEVASLGSRAKMRAKEGGKQEVSPRRLLRIFGGGWNEMEWNKAESDLHAFVVSQLRRSSSFSFCSARSCP